jgi:hypothetical protein
MASYSATVSLWLTPVLSAVLILPWLALPIAVLRYCGVL